MIYCTTIDKYMFPAPSVDWLFMAGCLKFLLINIPNIFIRSIVVSQYFFILVECLCFNFSFVLVGKILGEECFGNYIVYNGGHNEHAQFMFHFSFIINLSID